MASKKITGGCQCGAISYETEADPLFAVHCHCQDCKKASGAGHISALFVPKDKLNISGTTTSYQSPGDSGHMITRHFCPTCGGRLFGMPGGRSESLVGIMAGTLDDPELFKPEVQIYTKRRTSWDQLLGDVPEFESTPPSRE